MSSSKTISLFTGLLIAFAAHSQVLPDTASVSTLDSVVVTSAVRTVGIDGSAARGLDIRMSALAAYQQLLLRFLMKRLWYLLVILMFAACDNGYLELDNVEELVVEGWIESGHAPVVMVSSTLEISSTPQPLSNISEHILRYAEVYVEHNGEREYLTART